MIVYKGSLGASYSDTFASFIVLKGRMRRNNTKK